MMKARIFPFYLALGSLVAIALLSGLALQALWPTWRWEKIVRFIPLWNP
jgi:hypothetical protein